MLVSSVILYTDSLESNCDLHDISQIHDSSAVMGLHDSKLQLLLFMALFYNPLKEKKLGQTIEHRMQTVNDHVFQIAVI